MFVWLCNPIFSLGMPTPSTGNGLCGHNCISADCTERPNLDKMLYQFFSSWNMVSLWQPNDHWSTWYKDHDQVLPSDYLMISLLFLLNSRESHWGYFICCFPSWKQRRICCFMITESSGTCINEGPQSMAQYVIIMMYTSDLIGSTFVS